MAQRSDLTGDLVRIICSLPEIVAIFSPWSFASFQKPMRLGLHVFSGFLTLGRLVRLDMLKLHDLPF